MFNFNNFTKKFNKRLLSINKLIESFFNKLGDLKKPKSSNRFIILEKRDNKIILALGILVILTLSYFLIPTFYDQNDVRSQLKKQISKKYNLDVKFKKDLKYYLFPKPHFFSEEVIIDHQKKEFAFSKHTKIYISIKDFFSFNKLKIKGLFFKNTEFNTNASSVKFFYKTLNSNTSKHKIKFKNSKVFYRDKNENIIFLVKISDLNFLYNEKKIENNMVANYEVFNTPFKLDVKNDLNNKKILSSINSKKIRLNIENELNYKKNFLNGELGISLMGKEKSFNYKIRENHLEFSSLNNNLNGKIDFKPFYFDSSLKLQILNLKNLFSNDSIFITLIDSEIFNNPNLNANFNIKSNKISDANYLNDLDLRLNLNEGNLSIKDTNINWYDAIIIKFDEANLIVGKDDIRLIGSVNFNFKDLTKFYGYYQLKRNYRINVKDIKLDFIFNLNQKKIILDNLKIDNVDNPKMNDFLNNFNSKQNNIFNKVTFRNFVKAFFINFYDG